jgi:SAM-dependent methyltransferase
VPPADEALLRLEPGDQRLDPDELKSCCASIYEHPAVRWLLGGELHPGGGRSTRRALELIALARGDGLLDVASGTGASALLAAREFGATVTGVDYGKDAVLAATAVARAERLVERVRFARGDAEDLPIPDGSFDAVLCECSLCTFPDKPRAVAEMRRVLKPGGRVAISDVVVDAERLPDELLGPIGTIACVGSALTRSGYEELLAVGGFEILAVEDRARDTASFVDGIEERLRGARLLGLDGFAGSPFGIEEAIRLAGLARQAIADGAIAYSIFAASC